MTILERLTIKFSWLETQGLRVGALYLNAVDIAELEKHPNEYDRITHRVILETGLRGCLWGANVWECPEMVDGHVCILPAGVTVTEVEGTAGMPF